jgi:hypothetical protein
MSHVLSSQEGRKTEEQQAAMWFKQAEESNAESVARC